MDGGSHFGITSGHPGQEVWTQPAGPLEPQHEKTIAEGWEVSVPATSTAHAATRPPGPAWYRHEE